MSQIEINKKVPNFSSPSTGDKDITLAALKGSKVILYFYPKDNTPGCTTEGENFRDNYEQFKLANTIILGVSRDSIKTHENFKVKYDFPFDLLSDKDESLCQLFDVIKEKKNYGRTYMGIERSTFLIDKNGVLIKEWRKVKVAGHVDEVLDAVQ